MSEIKLQYESTDENDKILMKTTEGIPVYVVGKIYTATPLEPKCKMNEAEDKILVVKSS